MSEKYSKMSENISFGVFIGTGWFKTVKFRNVRDKKCQKIDLGPKMSERYPRCQYNKISFSHFFTLFSDIFAPARILEN